MRFDRTRQLDKNLTLGILSQAIDIARQGIWQSAAAKKLNKKVAEHMLVNFDNAMAYASVHLHNVLTGKTAQWVEKIDPKSGSVLLGHQAQATYIRLSFEDIWDLSVKVWEAEEEYQKQLAEELELAEKMRDIDDGIIQLDIKTDGQMRYRIEDVHTA